MSHNRRTQLPRTLSAHTPAHRDGDYYTHIELDHQKALIRTENDRRIPRLQIPHRETRVAGHIRLTARTRDNLVPAITRRGARGRADRDARGGVERDAGGQVRRGGDVWAGDQGAELALLAGAWGSGGRRYPVGVPGVVAERPDGGVPEDEVGVGDVGVEGEDVAAADGAEAADEVPAGAVGGDVGLCERAGGREDGEVAGWVGKS